MWEKLGTFAVEAGPKIWAGVKTAGRWVRDWRPGRKVVGIYENGLRVGEAVQEEGKGAHWARWGAGVVGTGIVLKTETGSDIAAGTVNGVKHGILAVTDAAAEGYGKTARKIGEDGTISDQQNSGQQGSSTLKNLGVEFGTGSLVGAGIGALGFAVPGIGWILGPILTIIGGLFGQKALNAVSSSSSSAPAAATPAAGASKQADAKAAQHEVTPPPPTPPVKQLPQKGQGNPAIG